VARKYWKPFLQYASPLRAGIYCHSKSMEQALRVSVKSYVRLFEEMINGFDVCFTNMRGERIRIRTCAHAVWEEKAITQVVSNIMVVTPPKKKTRKTKM
jgi:hypothetical protein